MAYYLGTLAGAGETPLLSLLLYLYWGNYLPAATELDNKENWEKLNKGSLDSPTVAVRL